MHYGNKLNDKIWLFFVVKAVQERNIGLLHFLFSQEKKEPLNYSQLTEMLCNLMLEQQKKLKHAVVFNDDLLQFLIDHVENDNNACVVKDATISLLHFTVINEAYEATAKLINDYTINEMTAEKFPPLEGRATPLMLAVAIGSPLLVKLLLDRGADPAIKNECKESALSLLKKTAFNAKLKDEIQSLLINALSLPSRFSDIHLFSQSMKPLTSLEPVITSPMQSL